MALPLLIASAIVVAATVLTWQQPAQERAEAAGGGPEMALSVKSGSTPCPMGTGPNTACVIAGDPFTVAIEAVGIPAPGYILARTFIDYATFNPATSDDGAGPNTFSDDIDNGGGDGKDRLDTDCVTVDLTYKPQAQVADEFVWPHLLDSTALRSEIAPGVVAHGALTGLFLPLPASLYIGNLVLLDFTCSASPTSTLVQLRSSGDPLALTSGSVYAEFELPDNSELGNLTITCVGPTPTPSDTPIPPTATPIVSRTRPTRQLRCLRLASGLK